MRLRSCSFKSWSRKKSARRRASRHIDDHGQSRVDIPSTRAHGRGQQLLSQVLELRKRVLGVRCNRLIQDVVDLYEKVQARTQKFTEVLEMRINKIWGSIDLVARFKCIDIDDHICLSVTRLEEDLALLCFSVSPINNSL